MKRNRAKIIVDLCGRGESATISIHKRTGIGIVELHWALSSMEKEGLVSVRDGFGPAAARGGRITALLTRAGMTWEDRAVARLKRKRGIDDVPWWIWFGVAMAVIYVAVRLGWRT